ncbi:hypothetical protein [Paraburkholderia terrae]|uniref:hypothetical protein n=1 Tax=Paraburkholderia terrae TaxID=311230 RepID=UPI001EE325FB|nr:hypothetical protein [Paraburkholderia terrae]GJH02280.1 hypothetical protein CBA19C8_17005 [Paraburkholderia terrae]
MNAAEFVQMASTDQKRWMDRYTGERDAQGLAVVTHVDDANRPHREFLCADMDQWMSAYKGPVQRQLRIINGNYTTSQRDAWTRWNEAPKGPVVLDIGSHYLQG